ncbi:hypothetical protein ACFQX6_33330 [Streptosporangium lutulentum]
MRRRPSAGGELRPDVTLVDIGLGEESGFDLARQLARAGCEERSRVILISAYAEKDFVDMIAASPAVAFLPKSCLSGRAISEILGAAGAGSLLPTAPPHSADRAYPRRGRRFRLEGRPASVIRGR